MFKFIAQLTSDLTEWDVWAPAFGRAETLA